MSWSGMACQWGWLG